MGFADSTKIARSLNVYTLIDKQFQRNDYAKLKEYLFSVGIDFPRKQKYIDIKDKMTSYGFTNEEMEYIQFFYKNMNIYFTIIDTIFLWSYN